MIHRSNKVKVAPTTQKSRIIFGNKSLRSLVAKSKQPQFRMTAIMPAKWKEALNWFALLFISDLGGNTPNLYS